MFNIVIFFLIVVIISLIIYLIYINITNNAKYLTAGETIIIKSSNVCTVNRDLLPVLDDNTNICCYDNNVKTGAYKLTTSGIVNGQTLPLTMSVMSTATYYVNVCRELCNNGYALTTNGDILCNGETSTLETQSIQANACANITAPRFSDGTPCKGSALPVGLVNNNLLYAYHIQTSTGLAQCNTVGPC